MKANKIALITGAGRGIGFETARQLGKQNVTVIIGARDEERGREAAHKLIAEDIDAHAVVLDVTDEATVNKAAEKIGREFGKLDILINNAGVALEGFSKPPSELEIDTLRRTFDTNFFGAFTVTKAMLPLLRLSDAGRIVNVSSGLGSLTLHGNPDWEFFQVNLLAYNSSKAALNMMTVQFAKELRETNIKVNSADPGFTATDMNRHTGTQTAEEGTIAIVRLATLPDDGVTGGYFDRDGSVPW